MGRVGLIGDNSVEYIKRLLLIWNNGDCAVLIDWRIPHREAEKMLQEAQVSKCYIDKRLSERIDNGCGDIEYSLFNSGNILSDLIPEEVYSMYQPNYSKSQEAVVLYSSGTTGKAKGVILSHYAINKNADLIAKYMELSSNDCIYIVKTLAHSSTLVGELLVGLKEKIKILITHTINNPHDILNNIKECNVTTMCVNPTILNLYVMTALSKKMSFNFLKTIYTSGSIASKSLIEKAKNTFTNVDILNVYGLSEAGPRVSAQRNMSNHSVESVGKPLDEVCVKIISHDGREVAPNISGVIHVKTPCLFTGYIKNISCKESLYNNWLNTGDIGYFNDYGELFITGRSDNMITIGSHNVYPEIIEDKIIKIQGIIDCAIISFYDEILGNKIICYYTSDKEVGDILYQFCITNLATYEIPVKFVRVDVIPTTVNGKKSRNCKDYYK